jgi:hypothetical protein
VERVETDDRRFRRQAVERGVSFDENQSGLRVGKNAFDTFGRIVRIDGDVSGPAFPDGERPMKMAMRSSPSSGAASCKWRARALERSLSSRYVRRTLPQTRATRSGVSAACDSKRSTTVLPFGTSPAV